MVDVANQIGQTPLSTAVNGGYANLAHELLQQGETKPWISPSLAPSTLLHR